MQDSNLKEIAQIILSQLNVRKTEMWAWGAKNYCYLERNINDNKYPAFQFSIRTPKVLRGGKVIISLDEGADEYIVEAIRMSKGIEKQLGKREMVHCGELHDVINSFIESEETYTKVYF